MLIRWGMGPSKHVAFMSKFNCIRQMLSNLWVGFYMRQYSLRCPLWDENTSKCLIDAPVSHRVKFGWELLRLFAFSSHDKPLKFQQTGNTQQSPIQKGSSKPTRTKIAKFYQTQIQRELTVSANTFFKKPTVFPIRFLIRTCLVINRKNQSF